MATSILYSSSEKLLEDSDEMKDCEKKGKFQYFKNKGVKKNHNNKII